MKNNLLDLLFARCPVETGGVRCWFPAEHEGDHRGPDGSPLAMPPPVGPACAWNDLGGCEGERLAVTFKDGNRGHLCQKHHEQWIYKPAVEPVEKKPCAWRLLGGCDEERVPAAFATKTEYLCRTHYESWSKPTPLPKAPCAECAELKDQLEDLRAHCQAMTEARADAIRSSGYWQEQFRLAMKPKPKPKPACSECEGYKQGRDHWQEAYFKACNERDGYKERLLKMCLAYGRVVGYTVQRDAIEEIEKRLDDESTVKRACSRACARCNTAIDEKGRFYAGVPGRGDLCLPCHQVVFP